MSLLEHYDFSQVKNEALLNSELEKLIVRFKIEECLFKAGITKEKGLSPLEMFKILFLVTLSRQRSIHEGLRHEGYLENKSAINDFINNPFINWEKLVYSVNKIFFKHFKSDAGKNNVLIIDDTPKEKTGSKVENLSWFRDHSTNTHYTGYQTIICSLTNERSSVILDFEHKIGKTRCKHSKKGQYQPASHTAHRQIAAKKTKNEICLSMIRRALKHGFSFQYVLWDSWYNNNVSFNYVFKKLVPKGIHLISMLKLGNEKYLYNGVEYTLKELYTKAGNWVQIEGSKIMTKSLEIQIIDKTDDERSASGTVKLCYFKYITRRQKARKKGKKNKTIKKVNYKALISTDLKLTEKEIFEQYSKRWGIEVINKDIKTYFGFNQSMSSKYAPMIADFSLKCIFYTMICSLKERSPNKSMYQLFFEFKREIEKHNIDTFILTVMESVMMEFIDLAVSLGYVQLNVSRDMLEELLYDFIHNEAYIDKIEEINKMKKRQLA